jgi:hypothetical protein
MLKMYKRPDAQPLSANVWTGRAKDSDTVTYSWCRMFVEQLNRQEIPVMAIEGSLSSSQYFTI